MTAKPADAETRTMDNVRVLLHNAERGLELALRRLRGDAPGLV